MKTLFIGIGAAGNKAIMEAVSNKVCAVEDAIIVNSTEKDFPKEFTGQKIILSPQNTGCGKESKVAKEYALTAIKSGKFNVKEIGSYSTVVFVTSVEGGTGSGSTPIIAKFFKQVHKKNVHVVAFCGFQEDVRGLGNTVEFFQEIDQELIVHTINNAAFLREAGMNKFKAESLANKEMCKRLTVLTGKDFVDSEQNIDDTDILKVTNTVGYMTIEKANIIKSLIDQDDFNKLIRKMIMDSKSIKSNNPGALRIGVILNVSPATEDAIDYSFADIKKAYGTPYEVFLQKQYDNATEYVAFIISGMQMPLEEIKAVYDTYKEQTALVNKDSDDFFKEMQGISLEETDKRFDMIRPVQQGKSVDEFMKQFETGK